MFSVAIESRQTKNGALFCWSNLCDIVGFTTFTQINRETAVRTAPKDTSISKGATFVTDHHLLPFTQLTKPPLFEFFTPDDFKTATAILIMYGHATESRFKCFHFFDDLTF